MAGRSRIWPAPCRRWSVQATRPRRCAGLFSSFTANDPLAAGGSRSREGPQPAGAAPRGHRRAAGVPRIAVRQRLRLEQPRVPRLRAGRPAVPVRSAGLSPSTDVRTDEGRMVPLQNVVRVSETTAPQVISHFNLFRSASISGIGGAGRELGAGAPGNGAAGDDDAAAGNGLRLDGAVGRGNQGGPSGAADLRPGDPAGVPHARGAVREPGPALHHPARRAAGGPWRARRAVDARAGQRRLLPGRARHARRPCGEELDPDRRVRRAAPRARHVDCRRRDRSGADPAAADPDDVAGVHPGRAAARVRDRRRPGGPPLGRDRGRRRHVPRHVPQHPSSSRCCMSSCRRCARGGHKPTTAAG